MEKRLILILVVIGLLLTSAVPVFAEIIEVSNKIYWVRTDDPVSVSPLSNSVGAVMCKQGDVVLGGGFDTGNYQAVPLDNRPIWQGWAVTIYNRSETNTIGFDVYAICMKSAI